MSTIDQLVAEQTERLDWIDLGQHAFAEP